MKWFHCAVRGRSFPQREGETVFRGQFSHTVDPKGRLSIPADFREVLADGFGDKLMVAPNGNALDVYPERTWKELEDKVSDLPLLDPDRRKFQYLYLSGGKTVVGALPARQRRAARRSPREVGVEGRLGMEREAVAHLPVLVDEVAFLLRPRRGGWVVDGTIGMGGHAERLLEAGGGSTRGLGIDRDPEAPG